MSTLGFQIDNIDEFLSSQSRAEVAAEAVEDDEESDIVETPAYDEELDLGEVVEA